MQRIDGSPTPVGSRPRWPHWPAGLVLLAWVICAAGCASFRGAPDHTLEGIDCSAWDGVNTAIAFDAKKDRYLAADPKTQVGCTATLSSLLRSDMEDTERNLYVQRGIIEINHAYGIYVRHLRNERVASGITAGLLDLSAEIASTLTDSVSVKENWNALGLLVNGTYGIVNEQAFMEKTVGALVESMNAARIQVRERLFAGMNRSVKEYTLAAAHSDLQDYAAAGTLEGGITFTQTVAKNAVDEVQARIDRADSLPELTEAEADASACVMDVLDATRPPPPSRAELTDAYNAIFGSAPPTRLSDSEIADDLRNRMRRSGGDGVSVAHALRKSGATAGVCP